MSYKLHNTAQPFLDKVRQHTEPYITTVLGKEIIVHPGVMSPKYDWSSAFIAKNLPDMSGKKVLEIGSGTGVLSLFAAFKGAEKIFALDINPSAVRNTQANFERCGLDASVFTAVESDLFSAIPENAKFDFIIFNAPFHGTKPRDALERSIADFKYETSERFYAEAANFLEPEGRILYAFGSMGDLAYVKKLWESNGFSIEKVVEDQLSNYVQEAENEWTCYLFTLKS
jgi:release factor glutamine methyltransferase